ncbi:MAG: agmatinase [Calditrichaceae bacterium]|nr:agmatinase [Calditrichia bacterium]NUQ43818.1 agmatinase [Calditrichaceae bacterium]
MNTTHLRPRAPYEGCRADFESAEIVLVGAGYDGTSSYRPGSRFAPGAIRAETFYSQEDYSPYFRRDLKEKPIHDAGDLDLPFGDRDGALALIYQTAREIFHAGKKPCFIGGEHLITLPLVQAALEAHPDLRIVQIDAHLDLMDELFGSPLSHGTVMRRCHDLLGEDRRIFQAAIRSGSKEEFEFAEAHTRLFPFHTRELAKETAALKGFPVYLTLDLDAFDPSLIPGTGTPEAGGIFFPEYIELLKALEGLNIVGCDMVELAPQLDPSNVSTIAATKILRELLMIV